MAEGMAVDVVVNVGVVAPLEPGSVDMEVNWLTLISRE